MSIFDILVPYYAYLPQKKSYLRYISVDFLAFDAILRSGVAAPWSQRLTKVKSLRAFGATGPHAHATLVGVCTGLTRSREFETNVREEVVHHIRMLWYILGGEERWDNVHRSYKQSPGKPGNGSFERGRSL